MAQLLRFREKKKKGTKHGMPLYRNKNKFVNHLKISGFLYCLLKKYRQNNMIIYTQTVVFSLTGQTGKVSEPLVSNKCVALKKY